MSRLSSRPVLLAFTLSCGIAPSPAAAAPPRLAPLPSSGSYTVRKGDTCAAIALRYYGNQERVDLIHDANPGMGTPPHHLEAGRTLRLPPRPDEPKAPAPPPLKVAARPAPVADAKVTYVRNTVEAYTPESHPAVRDEALLRGHRVNTLASSSAEVTFKDTSRMELGEHTLVVILGDSSGEAKKTANAGDTTLLKGTLRAHLAQLAGGKSAVLGLKTGLGQRVSVNGGEAQIDVDEKHTTRLSVYRGKSSIKSRNVVIPVAAGFGSKAEEGMAPSKPKPLPPKPTFATPPPSLLLAEGESASFESDYSVPAGLAADAVKTWHVQIAREPGFYDLVSDVRVDAAVTRLAARGLTTGDYYARVSAIDGDKFEGEFSATLATRVSLARITRGAFGRPATLSLPANVYCGLDGAEQRRAERTNAQRLRPGKHVLVCSLTGELERAGKLDIDLPVLPPPYLIDVRGGEYERSSYTSGGWIQYSVLVATATGEPVEGAMVDVSILGGDARAGVLHETDQPGVYATSIDWVTPPRDPCVEVKLRITANSAAPFDTAIRSSSDACQPAMPAKR